MGKGDWLDPFGSLFDLNGDGKRNIEEQWLEFATFYEWSKEEHARKWPDETEDMLPDDTEESKAEEEDEDELDFTDADIDEEETEPWACPACGDDLSDQDGFDPSEEDWVCDNCGACLHRDFEDDPYEIVEEDDDDCDAAAMELPSASCDSNKRMQHIASMAEWYKAGYGGFADSSEREEEIARLEWALRSTDLAARYMTFCDGFLLAQAVKDHFRLPISIPDEEDEVKTYMDDLVMELAEQDAALAADVWVWCIRVFSPYKKYLRNPYYLYNGILGSLEDYPITFVDEVIGRLGQDAAFRTALLTENPDDPYGMEQLLPRALEQDRIEEAKAIFAAVTARPVTNSKNLTDRIESVIDACRDGETLENMARFRLHILPMVREMDNNRVRRLLPEFEKKIDDYISCIENTEAYQYSGRFEWRTYCTDGWKYGVDPLDYETEEAYKAALYHAKYSWREECAEEAASNGLDVCAYETLEGYRAALNRIRCRWREECAEEAQSHGLDVRDYETQEEYQNALNNVKYAWCREFWDEARSYGLNTYSYETRKEYKEALYEARYGWRRMYYDLAEEYDLTVTRYDTEAQFLSAVEQQKRERLRKEHLEAKKQQETELRQRERTSDDKTIYRFCGVQFPNSSRVYHYRTGDETISIGDRVIVPSGRWNDEATAEVVSVELHLRKTAPYPVEQTKFILRKLQ